MEARKNLDFQYAFPTLKQRAILTVCRHWIDNRLVPQLCDGSSGLACLECEVSVCNLMPDAINRFVDNLAVPKSLKVDIYHVLDGLYHQLSQAFKGFFCCSTHKIGVYIDDSGRLDYLNFLRCCFKKNLDKNLDILYPMFRIACKACLLPEIDMVLRKIVTKVHGSDRDSEMLFDQSTHQSVSFRHVMIYRFLHGADATMIDRLNVTTMHMQFSKCHANQEHITITLHPFNPTIDGLKEHLSLVVDPEIRSNRVEYHVSRGDHWHFGTAYGLEVVKYLDQESTEGWASHVSEIGSPYFRLLNKLLVWPFTRFFVPTLNLLSPHVRDVDYCELFRAVVTRIPQKEPEYATLHQGLLRSLWSVMPLRLKQDCANWQRAKEDRMAHLLCGIEMHNFNERYFLEAMIRLKTRAPSLYNELVTEMQAVFDEQQTSVGA